MKQIKDLKLISTELVAFRMNFQYEVQEDVDGSEGGPSLGCETKTNLSERKKKL